MEMCNFILSYLQTIVIFLDKTRVQTSVVKVALYKCIYQLPLISGTARENVQTLDRRWRSGTDSDDMLLGMSSGKVFAQTKSCVTSCA